MNWNGSAASEGGGSALPLSFRPSLLRSRCRKCKPRCRTKVSRYPSRGPPPSSGEGPDDTSPWSTRPPSLYCTTTTRYPSCLSKLIVASPLRSPYRPSLVLYSSRRRGGARRGPLRLEVIILNIYHHCFRRAKSSADNKLPLILSLSARKAVPRRPLLLYLRGGARRWPLPPRLPSASASRSSANHLSAVELRPLLLEKPPCGLGVISRPCSSAFACDKWPSIEAVEGVPMGCN